MSSPLSINRSARMFQFSPYWRGKSPLTSSWRHILVRKVRTHMRQYRQSTTRCQRFLLHYYGGFSSYIQRIVLLGSKCCRRRRDNRLLQTSLRRQGWSRRNAFWKAVYSGFEVICCTSCGMTERCNTKCRSYDYSYSCSESLRPVIYVAFCCIMTINVRYSYAEARSRYISNLFRRSQLTCISKARFIRHLKKEASIHKAFLARHYASPPGM